MTIFSRLCTRYGNEIADPTELDLQYAIADLFNGIPPVADERPCAWFALGVTTGDLAPFHSLDVDRFGVVRFRYWPDSEATAEIEYTARATESEALMLWEQLRRQKTDSVLAWFLSRDDAVSSRHDGGL